MKFSELQRLQRREGITVLSADERIEQLEARLRAVAKERDELRAKIEAMERQEPVAWRTFDGEGGYDFRSYEENENYKLGWDARNPNHAGWVEPLYALPGAQPAPSVPDGWKLVPIEPTNAMLKAAQKEWLDDPLRRTTTMWKAMLAAAPEAKP